jgi:capsular polysaccharide biosynthesis protein
VKKLLCASSVAIRTLPVNIQAEDKKVFCKNATCFIPEVNLYEYANVIVTVDGVIIKNNNVINECLHKAEHTSWYDWKYVVANKIFKRKKKIKEPCLLVFNSWAEGYYHWMTETIPRLFLVKDLLEDCTLLLPSSSNRIYTNSGAIRRTIRPYFNKSPLYHLESLAPFGIKKIKIISITNNLSVDKLFMPTHVAPMGNYNERILREISLFYQKYFCSDLQSLPFKKIYISRSKAYRRRVINEAEVVNLLQRYQFEICFLEDLSFEKQVKLLYQAKFVVGLHGAGLTNMMFMQKGSSVLEFCANDDGENFCYNSMACSLGLNYYYQFGEKKSDLLSIQDSDMFVDTSLLEKNLLLADKQS